MIRAKSWLGWILILSLALLALLLTLAIPSSVGAVKAQRLAILGGMVL